MTKKKLSICIPTYNRGNCIHETISSALKDKSVLEYIELVISDNASSDNTEKIVKEFKSTYSNITYFRWNENMGPDRNFLKTVELAKGKFCWFMGSDDRVETGAIRQILDVIERYPYLSGISVNRTAYNINFNNLYKEQEIIGGNSDFKYTNAVKCIMELGLYFGYISGQIVNKDHWDEVIQNNNVSDFFNAYIHIYIIMKMLVANPQWYYLNYKCVGWRRGNDSFLASGYAKRLFIDVNGYEKISGAILGAGSSDYRLFMGYVIKTHIFNGVLQVKLNKPTLRESFDVLMVTLRKFWWSINYWCKIFPIILMPPQILIYIRAIKRLLKHNPNAV